MHVSRCALMLMVLVFRLLSLKKKIVKKKALLYPEIKKIYMFTLELNAV